MTEHRNLPGAAGAEISNEGTSDVLPEDEVVEVPSATKELADGPDHPSAYLPEVPDWDKQD